MGISAPAPAGPFHAHVYFGAGERAAAARLRAAMQAREDIRFVGALRDFPVGPHPMPQFELHFDASALDALLPMLERSGLRVLVHPLTDDDLVDHSTNARWIGDPLPLDLSVLDPPGRNKGVGRFGRSDV